MNEELRIELEQMRESDQQHRKLMLESVQKCGRESDEFRQLTAKQAEIDKRNVSRLVEIIERYGWPGRSQVGELGAQGAFLVLQHASLELQEKYLPLLRKGKEAGEVRGQSLALLEDRILMRQGKKQSYGSQLTTNSDGNSELWPIEDEVNVDKRRAEMGLGTLAEYLSRFGLEYVPKKGQ